MSEAFYIGWSVVKAVKHNNPWMYRWQTKMGSRGPFNYKKIPIELKDDRDSIIPPNCEGCGLGMDLHKTPDGFQYFTCFGQDDEGYECPNVMRRYWLPEDWQKPEDSPPGYWGTD